MATESLLLAEFAAKFSFCSQKTLCFFFANLQNGPYETEEVVCCLYSSLDIIQELIQSEKFETEGSILIEAEVQTKFPLPVQILSKRNNLSASSATKFLLFGVARISQRSFHLTVDLELISTCMSEFLFMPNNNLI